MCGGGGSTDCDCVKTFIISNWLQIHSLINVRSALLTLTIGKYLQMYF